MNPSWLPIAVLLAPAVCSAQYLDSRARAMGGTGVASSHYAAAAFLNPALLTRFDEKKDRFGIVLPSIGASVSDEHELIEGIDDFQDSVAILRTKLGNGTATAADRQQAIDDLNALDGRYAQVEAGAGLTVAVPGRRFAWSLVADTYVEGVVVPSIDPGDAAIINGATTPADLDNIKSQGSIIGSAVSEIGLAMATRFGLGSLASLAVGVTPKMQRIDTYNYSVNINTFDRDDFRDSQYRNDSTEFNVDAGAAAFLGEHVTVGVTGRNLIEHEVDTVVTNGTQFQRTVSPTLVAGAAFTAAGFTVAADIDIVEIERFELDDESRFLRLGAEYDLAGWLQIRGGYRNDLENILVDIYSGGLGFAIAERVHIDLTGSFGEGNTYGGVLQLWFTF